MTAEILIRVRDTAVSVEVHAENIVEELVLMQRLEAQRPHVALGVVDALDAALAKIRERGERLIAAVFSEDLNDGGPESPGPQKGTSS